MSSKYLAKPAVERNRCVRGRQGPKVDGPPRRIPENEEHPILTKYLEVGSDHENLKIREAACSHEVCLTTSVVYSSSGSGMYTSKQ